MAVSPPEGPGWSSTSPARGSRSKVKTPCSGTREPRKAATSGGTWRHFGCTPSLPRVVRRGHIELLIESGRGCWHQPWGSPRQRHGAHGGAVWRRGRQAWRARTQARTAPHRPSLCHPLGGR
eukprot:6121937-Pleurochrysis_carterae.AAC.5